MALKIRMARYGAKKRPFYWIVVADARAPRDGKFIEKLGTHNPLLTHENPSRVVMNIERVKYWLSVGAKPSDRLTKFFSKEGLVANPVTPSQTKKDQPRKKAQERLKEEAQRAIDAEEAAKKAAEAEAQAAAEAAAAPVAEEIVEEVVEETPAAEESAPEMEIEVELEPETPASESEEPTSEPEVSEPEAETPTPDEPKPEDSQE